MEPETNDLKLTPELEAIVRLASETAVESYRKELERQQEQDGKARRERQSSPALLAVLPQER